MSAILLVEDDQNLRLTLEENLVDQGYLVTAVATIAEAEAALAANKVELVVLDLMLPDGDGTQLCRKIRAARLPIRVLMLTARSLEDDLVKGFDAGADDYLAKPYRLRELLARVASLLRRGEVKRTVHRFGDYRLDEAARVVEGPKGPVALTRKEFDLLLALLERPGEVLSRDEILDRVWGADVVVDVHTVDNFVSSLKKKLPAVGDRLKTVRGVGFKFEVVSGG